MVPRPCLSVCPRTHTWESPEPFDLRHLVRLAGSRRGVETRQKTVVSVGSEGVRTREWSATDRRRA